MNSIESKETESLKPFSLLEYVESNPVAAVVQALAIGFLVGMLVRLIEGSRTKEPEIDVERKPTLDDAKFHIGSLILPFLWPAWQSARKKVGTSAGKVRETVDNVRDTVESVRETVEKLKRGDFNAEGKKRLRQVEAWAEREAEKLAELGKEKAKDVEHWMEKEVLPAAEGGWKKLQKFIKSIQ